MDGKEWKGREAVGCAFKLVAYCHSEVQSHSPKKDYVQCKSIDEALPLPSMSFAGGVISRR